MCSTFPAVQFAGVAHTTVRLLSAQNQLGPAILCLPRRHRASMTNLASLSLDYCPLGNVNFLSALAELRYLYLGYNNLSDLSPLAGLTNLEILTTSENPLTNAAVLGGLPSKSIEDPTATRPPGGSRLTSATARCRASPGFAKRGWRDRLCPRPTSGRSGRARPLDRWAPRPPRRPFLAPRPQRTTPRKWT